MSAPPVAATDLKPTGGLVSATVADQAASAIRRAGYKPTPGNIRMVLRAQRAVCDIPPTDFEWWDRLVRSVPLGARPTRRRRASDTSLDGWTRR